MMELTNEDFKMATYVFKGLKKNMNISSEQIENFRELEPDGNP